MKTLVKTAWRQARLWPLQNHAILTILFFFALVVFLNLLVTGFWLPSLVKSLLGIESVFTRSWRFVLNTTFLATTASVTWLALAPVIITAYTLRCFYGSSLRSGNDLKVELTTLKAAGRAGVTLLLAGSALLLSGSPAPAAQGRLESAKPPAVSAAELDESIKEIIARSEYTWRMPKEKRDHSEQSGPLVEFLEWLAEHLDSALDTISDWVKSIIDWFNELLPKPEPGPDRRRSDAGWLQSVHAIHWIILGVLLSVLAILVYRAWRKRGRVEVVMAEAAARAAPDVSREDVSPEELPGARWRDLARDLMNQGEFRLALRALFLGTLALLAENEIITIARHKSNREYQWELKRRAMGKRGAARPFCPGHQDVRSGLVWRLPDRPRRRGRFPGESGQYTVSCGTCIPNRARSELVDCRDRAWPAGAGISTARPIHRQSSGQK